MLAKDKKPKPPMTYRHRGRLCNCQAQIADILARLEKVEREALPVEVSQFLRRGGSLPEHIAQALKQQGY